MPYERLEKPTTYVDDSAPQDQTSVDEVLALLPLLFKEAKEGYKTTEFWFSIAVVVLTWVDAIPLPDKYEGAVAFLAAAVYAISRGLAKKGVPAPADPKEVRQLVEQARG